VLVENGHYKTAKAYILYREEHKRLRDVKALLLNTGDVIDNYISRNEWRIKENANVDFSYSAIPSETITIRTEVNKNVYVGFFDITLIGSETTYKDKFQKSYTLP